MAILKPFNCIRPDKEVVRDVAALPYDVYNRKEAKAKVQNNPLSFLNIDRPETQYDDDFDMYSDKAYETARDLLWNQLKKGIYLKDEDKRYYLYELIMDGRSQTGIVGVASIDDYVSGIIKKHENTRKDKEEDRIRHVDTVNAQTGPIFLAYRKNAVLKSIIMKEKKNAPLYDFVSDDGITHRVWRVAMSEHIQGIEQAFTGIDSLYIADGHHRAASAVAVGLKRRAENPSYLGNEEFNFFLSVVFDEEELEILPYNRAVKDLNGLSAEAFLQCLEEDFTIRKADSRVEPDAFTRFGLYIKEGDVGVWYELVAKEHIKSEDPVAGLDASILQDRVLSPILGIGDPRTDKRIDFIGGIRGIKELERLVDEEGYALAFAMYPTSMEQLLSVADASLLMPPKSTWFEPKLRSGIFIHALDK